MQTINNLRQQYQSMFEGEPVWVRAPGRINLIGEHTDYNEGFVLPAAIDKHIFMVAGPAEGSQVKLISADLDQQFEFDLHDLQSSDLGWPNYIMGVVQSLQDHGYQIGAFNCIFGGDIPIGAGLSSSAALESSTLFALNELYQLGINSFEMAKLGQYAENKFVGVQCGIMDQFASIHGKADHVIQLDCRSLGYALFPLHMKDHIIALCNTQVSHSLASSEYNTRREQCEAGVAILQQHYPEIKSLRDVNIDQLTAHQAEMDPIVFQRCEYILEENQRVNLATRLLEANDLAGFGKRMYESHEGLQHKYEVSCPELDFLVDATRDKAYVWGARMMGGGFGGCTINLVEEKAIDTFCKEMAAAFQQEYKQDLPIYLAKIVDGVSGFS